MRKRTFAAGALAALAALALYAAAAGDAGDPLVSLSYLEGAYAGLLDEQIERKLDEADRALLEASGGAQTDPAVPGGTDSADLWTEHLLKEGDALSGSTGFGILPMTAGLRVDYAGAAVVDVTAGETVPSGAALTANHRYLVAEDTSASFTVTALTAVAEVQGAYTLNPSDSVDYHTMAQALKTLGLFKGSLTAYGQGFDLDKAPTRLQALIMFIRVLGEEPEALAWTGTTPFTDLAKGTDAERYVGYAYERGYTNGFTATTFRPGQTVNANQYAEFLLRALGYSSTTNTDLTGTMIRASVCGLLTEEEAAALWSGTFLRAQLVYLSCRAVETPAADGGGTLGDRLMEKGVYTFVEADAAKALLASAGHL